ncbi:hypothetical protein AHAS_Ahas07G0089100 [Arachis hypogaea]
MDPMNLDSKTDLLRSIIIVSISLLLYPIISMTTLSTTPIASFNFFSEPMFSNRFNFHMSGNGDITRCTDSLDARESSHDVLMSNNLYCLSESGERRALGVVVELGLEDVVDVSGLEVGATRVTITPWLNLGAKEEEGKDGKEDYESEEGEYEC